MRFTGSRGTAVRDSEFSCQNTACSYKFKVFDKFENADKFREIQPSTKPKDIIPVGNKYVVYYCYTEVEPFRVERLTDVVDEDTIRMLLRGFAFRSKLSLVIIEQNKELIDGKEYRRIEPEIEHGDFCRFIRNLGPELEDGKRKWDMECNLSVYTIAKELFNSPANQIFERHCWAGLKKKFLPLSINNKNVGMLVCSDIRLDNKEEKDKFREGLKQISEVINLTDLEKENLNKEKNNLLRHFLMAQVQIFF